MADLSDIQAAASVKVVGSDSSGLETNPVSAPTTTPSLTDPGLTVRTLPFEPDFYSAVAPQFAVPALATDVFTITGSASKTIRVKRIRITGTTTSGSPIGINIRLIKRSTANSGGTSVNDIEVPFDSLSPSATATVLHYTANPTLGTAIGEVACSRTAFTQSGIPGGDLIFDFKENPVILRGTSQVLAVNFNGITVTGSNICITVEWAEV